MTDIIVLNQSGNDYSWRGYSGFDSFKTYKSEKEDLLTRALRHTELIGLTLEGGVDSSF